jgi:hypothetical protein
MPAAPESIHIVVQSARLTELPPEFVVAMVMGLPLVSGASTMLWV